MASKGRRRRHRAQAYGRAPYQSGTVRRSRYAKTRRATALGPNGKAARAAAHRGLGRVVAAADTASSLHAGIAAVGAAYGAAKAGKKYLEHRRRKKSGVRRDSKGRFR
jgi:hypothetical protein